MKILVALDAKDYSKKIVKEVARLTENTLADIVFLGVQENTQEPAHSLVNALLKYQHDRSWGCPVNDGQVPGLRHHQCRCRTVGPSV